MKSCVRNAYRLHPFRSRSRLMAPAPECRVTAGPDPMVAEVAARNAKGTTKKSCGESKAWLAKSWNRVRRLGKAQRGVAALEYALLAPLLFGVIFVAVEATVMLFAGSSLEAAAERVCIGKLAVPARTMCEQALRAEIGPGIDAVAAHGVQGAGALTGLHLSR